MKPKFKPGDRIIVIPNTINHGSLWYNKGTIKRARPLKNSVANNLKYGFYYYEVEWDEKHRTSTPAEKQIEHEWLFDNPLTNALKE
jgi:hypothetical protein